MRSIRVLCLAGGATALLGALVLWLSYLLGPGESGTTQSAHNVAGIAGLLLVTVGGFLFLCTAPVPVIMFLTKPRTRAAENAR